MANYKKELFEHQRTAVSECRRKNSNVFAYLMEMGTGKTITAIHDMLDLYSENKINSVVIFGPCIVTGIQRLQSIQIRRCESLPGTLL